MADTRPRLEPLDGRPGPARPLSPAQARALIHGAVGRLMSGDVGATGGRRARRWTRMRQAGIALAGLAVVGSAAAGVGLVVRSSTRERPPAVGKSRALPAPVTLAPPAPPAEQESEEVAAPPLRRRHDPPVRTTRRTRAQRTRAALAPPVQAPAVDELARANQLRAHQRWSEAAHAYAAVADRADGTQEAYVADLARAGLLLERLDRPAEALAIYRRARSASQWGPLRQEALYGEAACYQALGDAAAERAALESFLGEFPATPLRAAVERRLAEIR